MKKSHIAFLATPILLTAITPLPYLYFTNEFNGSIVTTDFWIKASTFFYNITNPIATLATIFVAFVSFSNYLDEQKRKDKQRHQDEQSRKEKEEKEKRLKTYKSTVSNISSDYEELLTSLEKIEKHLDEFETLIKSTNPANLQMTKDIIKVTSMKFTYEMIASRELNKTYSASIDNTKKAISADQKIDSHNKSDLFQRIKKIEGNSGKVISKTSNICSLIKMYIKLLKIDFEKDLMEQLK